MIYKCINQTEAVSIPTKDGGQTQKCSLLLREIGGDYENKYICTVFGNSASVNYKDSLVIARLSFRTHDHDGATYQDIVVKEIIKIPFAA